MCQFEHKSTPVPGRILVWGVVIDLAYEGFTSLIDTFTDVDSAKRG